MSKTVQYLSNNEIEISGTKLFIDDGQTDALFRDKNRDDAYFVAKSRGYLESYEFINKVFPITQRPQLNILELGIYSGGSAVFFDKMYAPKKLVCIDYMSQPAAALTRYINEEAGNRIKPYYGTDQAERSRVTQIIDSEFDGPIDLVIDDASHWYEETRASFETIFPRMRPGGLFLLEDWTWAHGEAAQKPGFYWAEKTSLSNLVFQMTMAHATSLSIISRMVFLTGLVVVERGEAELPPDWTLDSYERPRKRALSLI